MGGRANSGRQGSGTVPWHGRLSRSGLRVPGRSPSVIGKARRGTRPIMPPSTAPERGARSLRAVGEIHVLVGDLAAEPADKPEARRVAYRP